MKVNKIRSYIAFWNPKRTIDTPLLNAVLSAAIENKNLHFQYESKSGIKTKHVHPIGVYAHDGLWYLPSYDFRRKKYYCIVLIVFFLYYQQKKMKVRS